MIFTNSYLLVITKIYKIYTNMKKSFQIILAAHFIYFFYYKENYVKIGNKISKFFLEHYMC